MQFECTSVLAGYKYPPLCAQHLREIRADPPADECFLTILGFILSLKASQACLQVHASYFRILLSAQVANHHPIIA